MYLRTDCLRGCGARISFMITLFQIKERNEEFILEPVENLFKWKHYESEIILLTIRWYLKYCLSYRDVSEMMKERGVNISYTKTMRWIHQFGPEIDKRNRPFLIAVSYGCHLIH